MPKFNQIPLPNNGLIVLWKITENLEDLIQIARLNTTDQNRLETIKSIHRKKEWVAVRCILKTQFKKEYIIKYLKSGAPRLEPPDHKISISHSNAIAGILLNKENYAGIDIQIITQKINNIKHKFIHVKELDLFKDDLNIQNLHLIWSAKEAVYKAIEIPGVSFSEEMYISKPDDENKFFCTINMGLAITVVWLCYEIIEDYIVVYTIN